MNSKNLEREKNKEEYSVIYFIFFCFVWVMKDLIEIVVVDQNRW